MISAAVGGLARVSLEMKSAECEGCLPKKEQGRKPCSKNCVDPFSRVVLI
jgi:hypothetical protein